MNRPTESVTETVKESFKGHIARLASDASGVIRTPGQKVIFVPMALPNEDIRYVVTSNTARYQRARLIEILSPSECRVQAPCPHFGTCGGCQLQHLAHQEHLKQKLAWFLDSCQRLGKLDRQNLDRLACKTTAVSLKPWSYRQRARFHLSARAKGPHSRVLGFRSDGDSTDMTAVESCNILVPEIQGALDHLRIVLNALALPPDDLQVEVTHCQGPWTATGTASAASVSLGDVDSALGGQSALALSLYAGGRKRLTVPEGLRRKCLEELEKRGVRVMTPDHGDLLRVAPETPEGFLASASAAARAPFAIHRLGFLQPHIQSPVLYRSFVEDILSDLSERPDPSGPTDSAEGAMAWDLYGGSGLFAQLLATPRGPERTGALNVLLVESSPYAVEAARQLFARNRKDSIDTRAPGNVHGPRRGVVTFAPENVQDFLRSALKHKGLELPRLIVADPPRSGLEDAVVQQLARVAQKAQAKGADLDLVLISCDPAAAARDLGSLTRLGFVIEKAALVDAFGQTLHYECLTHLRYLPQESMTDSHPAR